MPNTKPFAYFGTPYVARDTLALLLDAGYKPSVVITSPDAPRGRGLTLTPSETKVLATEHGIPVLTPQKLTSEAISEVASYGCEYAVVVAYGKILPQALIDTFPLGVLNVHYSLLPKYRGASPVEAALLNGDETTGVSVQRMVYALDAGDVLASCGVAIEPTETTHELRARLITLGAYLLIDSLPSFENGTAAFTPQDNEAATFAGKIAKSEGELQIPGDDLLNWRKYRAFVESPGTYFFIEKNGRRVRMKITKARFENGMFVIERVIPEGKREMPFEDAMR